MALVLQDPVIRAQLHSDMKIGWSCKKIYDQPPQLPSNASALPQGFVELQKVTPQQAGGGAGAKEVNAPHIYLLTGLFPFPTDGTPVGKAQIASAQALLNLLTASLRYVGWKRNVVEIAFDTDKIEPQEPVYAVQITFSVEVIANV